MLPLRPSLRHTGLARHLILAACLLVATYGATADSSDGAPWANNARGSVDISSRIIRSRGTTSSLHALGLDYQKIFSNRRGDIGTLTIQPYLLRIDNSPAPSALFSDNHDEALQWRITNFNYTRLGRGRLNIRLGHFELPFGLEQTIQTNGTLYQMNAPANTGLKADWGVSVNGELPRLEYEVAFMRGGGNKLRSEADGYFVGRIGVPRYQPKWVGLSYLRGEMAAGENLAHRNRLGVDAGIRLDNGAHTLLEYSAGKDDGFRSAHFLGEVGYTTPGEALVTYLQWRESKQNQSSPIGSSRKSVVGFRYEPNAHWSLSVEYQHSHNTDRFPAAVFSQLRVRS